MFFLCRVLMTFPNRKKIGQRAVIYPDYSGITIPCNIAPLNFAVKEVADNYVAVYKVKGREMFRVHSGDGIISVPSKNGVNC